MSNHLSSSTKTIRVMNGVVAGTTDQDSDSVDMAAVGPADSIRFTVLFGALSANQVTSAKVQVSSDDGDTDDWTDLDGVATSALADTDSNKVLILDVVRPPKQLVRCHIDRATGNAVIDGVIADVYGYRVLPVATDATVKELVASVDPAEA